MVNITMKVDQQVLKKARKYAIDHNTTVSALVRKYLNRLALHEESEKSVLLKELDKQFKKHSQVMGKKSWTRDDLHKR